MLVTTFVNGQNDKEAEQLLNAVNDKTASYENISITFKYVLSNISENIKEQVDGDVLIEGDKYKLNIMVLPESLMERPCIPLAQKMKKSPFLLKIVKMRTPLPQ